MLTLYMFWGRKKFNVNKLKIFNLSTVTNFYMCKVYILKYLKLFSIKYVLIKI